MELETLGQVLSVPLITPKYMSLLCVEFVVGLLVAMPNLLMIIILVIGRRKLMKNHFYVVLSNLIVFTSLKGFVELAFVLPYYIQQMGDRSKMAQYYNSCLNVSNGLLSILFNCLIYLSYACTMVVFILRQRRKMSDNADNTTQMRLLKQSVIVFMMYLASIVSVLVISFVPQPNFIDAFYIAYIENILNLSIAAVYPICFLAMSSEMRKLITRSSDRVSSLGSNPIT
ncbi:hypothetical protein PRIPAC_78940 [Pristionchus pacificus]|uniref:Uncharacterized protein n=1 Tax=Pristionchus pacificus TaxID=54126 RepID=A0A2A6CN85_PRIPA|nr:hypothetical protein PRIPAC_78940 [Pristionchus pacificus]|eukprot:PDM79560.1 hypothetical protein PRIPAC_32139 [Pristionchus pacificus]